MKKGMHSIYADRSIVQMWIDREIPYEPSKNANAQSLITARNELRIKLNALDCGVGRGLEAAFHSKNGSKSDLENVLFYNIKGTGLSKLIQKSVKFKSHKENHPASPDGHQYNCFYEYKVVPILPIIHSTNSSFIEFDISKIKIDSAHTIWWKAVNSSSVNHLRIDNKFKLFISIYSRNFRINVNNLKWITDGIISSCHFYKDPKLSFLENKFPEKHWDRALVTDRLISPPNPILGIGKLTSTQWSPADDLCEECSVEVVSSDINICKFTILPA